jgi:hypothetical protein
VRREDSRWHTVPTPSYTRPEAVPLAWRVEPRCATRRQEWKLQEWRLDCPIEERKWLRSLVRSFAKTGTRALRRNRGSVARNRGSVSHRGPDRAGGKASEGKREVTVTHITVNGRSVAVQQPRSNFAISVGK